MLLRTLLCHIACLTHVLCCVCACLYLSLSPLLTCSVRGTAPETGSFSWSLCDPSENASDKLQNLKVTVSPDPPVAGQNITVTGSGDLTETVTAGTVEYTALGFLHGSLDLCTELSKTQYPCPLSAGARSVGPISFAIPSIVPKGIPISAKATIKDQSGNQLTCVDIKLEL